MNVYILTIEPDDREGWPETVGAYATVEAAQRAAPGKSWRWEREDGERRPTWRGERPTGATQLAWVTEFRVPENRDRQEDSQTHG
jgi:hypothetical protein